eukprot:RCo016085
MPLSCNDVKQWFGPMSGARLFYFIAVGLLITLSIAACFVQEADQAWDTTVIVPGDVAWMLVSTGLVLLMTPGLAFFYGGMVGSKNVISTILQNVISMGLISVLWVVFGFSLAFGEDSNHFIGKIDTYWLFKDVGVQTTPIHPTIPRSLYAIFQMMFAIITPSLITGSFAERIRFDAFLIYITLWHIVVYCPLAHWTWH